MYTLKIEYAGLEYLRIAQSLVQDGKSWSYEMEMGRDYHTVTLSTPSVRDLKRLVDLLESVEFMREQN